MHPNRSQADRVQEQLIDRNTPAIPNMARNCVEENSLENISQDLVQPTVPTPDTQTSASFDSKSEEREEIADVSTPAPALGRTEEQSTHTPGSTPALALGRTEEQSTHTPGSRKSTRKNFGKPASSFSDFYM